MPLAISPGMNSFMTCIVKTCSLPPRQGADLCERHYAALASGGQILQLAGLRAANLRTERKLMLPWRVPAPFVDAIRLAAQLSGELPGTWLAKALEQAIPWKQMARGAIDPHRDGATVRVSATEAAGRICPHGVATNNCRYCTGKE